MIMNVKKINKDAVIPMFAHPTDSGLTYSHVKI